MEVNARNSHFQNGIEAKLLQTVIQVCRAKKKKKERRRKNSLLFHSRLGEDKQLF
jgi:hypothetical protein